MQCVGNQARNSAYRFDCAQTLQHFFPQPKWLGNETANQAYSFWPSTSKGAVMDKRVIAIWPSNSDHANTPCFPLPPLAPQARFQDSPRPIDRSNYRPSKRSRGRRGIRCLEGEPAWRCTRRAIEPRDSMILLTLRQRAWNRQRR